MASNNETNSLLSSSNDKSSCKKHLNEHEETIKSDQMASKKPLSNDGEEQIASMDENDLKNLLDEALTYKNPRDANEKSETFKRLLQNVTEEEEHKRKFESNSLHWKAQSNSLQNLLDESHYQLQNHQSQISSKKHQQRRKNSTSVSTRRLEGGSLPIDMHHSSTIQSPPDQPFLSELKNNKKRKERQPGGSFVIDMPDVETDDRKSFQRCFDPNKDTTSYHDAIEMKPFSNNRVEMEVQESASKFTTANRTPNTITTMASIMTPAGNSIPTIMSKGLSTTSSVDARIQFSSMLETPKSYQQAQTIDTLYAPSTINHNNNIILTGGGSSSYSSSASTGKSGVDQPLSFPAEAFNSVMDSKPFSNTKYKGGQTRDEASSLSQTTSSILSTNHTSTTTTTTTTAVLKDNSKASKKRTAKSERNEKKIDVERIEGYRGNDPLEKLLIYIDGQHNNSNADNKGQKNHPRNGIVSNNANISNNEKQTNEQLLNADDKKKKLVSKNKEKMNKLKKSNSMDELCSTGRQQEKEKSVTVTDSSPTANKIVQGVTLRSKNNNNNNSNQMTSGANKKVENKTDKWQTKRNERRSWGTEGLWPDTAAASNDIIPLSKPENIEDNNENESSSSSTSGAQLDLKTSESVNVANSNLESINTSSEADKFQVVIKKKKVKRKSSENTETFSNKGTSHNLQTYAVRRDANLRTGTKSNNANNNTESSSRNDRNPNPNNNNNNNNNKYDNKNSKQVSQDAKQSSIGKNRRKSTSSMPHSDDEYSDGGDSVQSLPIETTKTTSSLLSAPNNNNNNSNANNNHSSAEISGKVMTKSNKNTSVSSPTTQISPSQQQQPTSIQQKPTTFSYADIAKTNSHRTNTNNVPASTEKMWPSISSSASSTHQNSNINNLNNNNDPFAISNFDAISSNTLNINNINTISSNSSVNNATAGNLSSKQHKSTPSLNNTMSFPDLVVESNNSKNKQLSNNSMDTTSNGDATQTDKSLNGLERAFDNNNSPAAIAINTHDRLNNNIAGNNNNSNNQKISYSQSLLENHNHQEIDANGNNSNPKLENTAGTVANVNKNTLTKSKSVDQNNLSSIEHYPALEKTKQTLSDVLSKPFENLSGKTSKTKQPLQQQIKIGNAVETIVRDESGGKKKKDKLALKKSTSTVSTSTSSQQYSTQTSTNNARPAVIIMDDCEKSSEIELGITFGFDINEHLLFGHHNGDAVAEIGHSVEMNINNNIKNNNSNCDIMNTNLSSNNTININNLTNQSCGFEIYDNFISSPQCVIIDHSQQMMQQHHVTVLQSSISNNDNTTTLLDSSNDLGYMSSSLITNSTTSPANQKLSNETQQQPPNDTNDNSQYEFDHQIPNYPNAMDIKQHMKLDELISRFVSPEPAKNFNYDELVTFVSEEWTKVERNGVIFNDDAELYDVKLYF